MELLTIKKSSENYVSKILDSNYIQIYNLDNKNLKYNKKYLLFH